MSKLQFSKESYTLATGTTTRDGLAVTPDDSNDLPNGPCRGVYVTGAGNVSVNLATGGTAVLTTLGAGQVVDINVSRILSTSTTATGIYALYAPANV